MRLHFLFAILFITVSAYSQEQFENGGFEEWEEVGLGADLMEPVNWSSVKTSDVPNLNPVAPVVWGKSTDAHSGSYSVYLINKKSFGIIAPGTITNGRVHADINKENAYIYSVTSDSKWHSVLTGRPDSLVGWFKANPASGDFGNIIVDLHVGEYKRPGNSADTANLIGKAEFNLPGDTIKDWTRFSVSFEYFQEGNPGYQLTIITSGNGIDAVDSSEAWFDDLELIYNNSTSVESHEDLNKLFVFSSNGMINIRMDGKSNTEYRVMVCDILGRQVYNKTLLSNVNLQLNPGRSKGIYIVKLTDGYKNYTRKIFVD